MTENPYDIKVLVEHEIDLSDIIFDLVYRCEDPKKIITIYGSSCLCCGQYSPDKKNIEIEKAGIILGYVIKNWDKLYEPALNHYRECIKKVEENRN